MSQNSPMESSSSSRRHSPSEEPAQPHASTSTDAFRDTLATKIRMPTKATRRMRGEIACAECRRLKIRCDRTVPCSTCVKRGCGALCPNGTIPPGEGSRFVLAASDHLRQKLSKLEARMRSLEDALAIIHASESDEPHPLLSVGEDFEEPEPEPDVLKPLVDEKSQSPQPLSETLGTLCVDTHGGSRFFGPTGGAESLLMTSDGGAAPSTQPSSHVLEELDPSYLSPQINQCYQSFPFTPPNVVVSAVQPMIESFLPSMDRAITLCDTFLEHLSWMFHIVSRHKLLNELIPIIYKQAPVPYGPHDLALLLIVLGIGSLVDLNLPPYNLEAQHYYRLTRATLALQPVLGAQSVVTIKVLHLMSIYNGMSGKESNLEQSYVLLDLAGQVALGIGFHVDPSMWGFEGREAYDRRVYFWNLMSAVLWQSLVTGRPPSLLMSYIDCRIPSPEDENLFQEGEVPLGFGIWGFKASQECLIPLVRAILAAKPPTYETVMELDQKIRDFVPPRPDSSVNQTSRTAMSMRTFVRSHYQDLMLLFLHRPYFAQAMTEYPDNPLSSPYSQSVIVGTVAIRGVHLNLKPPPLDEFEAIFKVFTSAAETSSRAARALPVLNAMLQKAYQAHQYYHEKGKPAPSQADDVDELSYFAGGTKIIKREDSVLPSARASPDRTSPSRFAVPSVPMAPRIHQPQASHVIQSLPMRMEPSMVAIKQVPLNPSTISSSPLTYPPSSQANIELPPTGPARDIYQQSSTDFRLPPLMIPSIISGPPPQRPQQRRRLQTFADLSGGWNGMFHEVAPAYGLRISNTRANLSGRGSPARLSSTSAGSSAGQSQQYPQSFTPINNDAIMLDDRWASFMNYDLFRDFPQ
ncbi:unnamed protein product [Cyclocybe aegerita]|uniref:Zn(2)-C6 fungal-type domain-containing protein n=1 Tax=Cyclocybe aegerita TaxID=1973307 RepID=A0A8S0WSJ9_CYCAE|nr:unnamed protein product [Cyclocybe aegerita]